MGITKRLNWQSIFIFLFLIIFPFGQVIRIGLLQPIDLIVGLAAIYTIIKRLETPKAIKYLAPFVIVAGFTWFFSIFIFKQVSVLYGLLYLFRLAAYYYFGIYVWNFVKDKADKIKLLLDSLLAVSVFAGIFGWIQFFTVPDIKPFFKMGWDMHLFRLVGTFLDPAFLGLILVFGLILSIHRWIDNRNGKNISNVLITAFLLISLAFTYSRASYLAFITGIVVIIFLTKRLKKLILLVALLVLIAFLLPTAKNHSIELFRTFSALSRIDNYKTTLQIFSKSPVFGIGYNNMCIAYQKYIGEQSFSSHACSGSDSSLLMILATTGVTGFMIFIFSIINIGLSLRRNTNFLFLSSSFLAMLTHSLFCNSMFYPWILGYLIILLAVNVKR